LAGLLLAGLISDTLLLTSPTTTERDHQAAERLVRWAFIGGSVLDGETLESYGKQILQAGADLSARSPADIVNADLKIYEAGNFKFGIAQTEMTNFAQLEERLEEIRAALVALRDAKGLDFALLMATNVVEGSSRLILTDDVAMLDVLPYPRSDDGTRTAQGVVSRKKQLLPLVLGALEG
jgi:manganese-dependent inorganic pyrophosphatase